MVRSEPLGLRPERLGAGQEPFPRLRPPTPTACLHCNRGPQPSLSNLLGLGQPHLDPDFDPPLPPSIPRHGTCLPKGERNSTSCSDISPTEGMAPGRRKPRGRGLLGKVGINPLPPPPGCWPGPGFSQPAPRTTSEGARWVKPPLHLPRKEGHGKSTRPRGEGGQVQPNRQGPRLRRGGGPTT